ncbi:hypothetical protein NFI96_031121, partial [Prochilodus magdalenae]
NTWMWVDRANFNYTNWFSLEDVSSRPCTYMNSFVGWTNTYCVDGLPFICVNMPQC